tara:strand:+ start:259 stop:477 length:219 start_codon:yes stop_codon:yes gene_type:complete
LIDKEERTVFGWLGRIPSEIMNSSSTIVRSYKALSKDAKTVAHMKNTETKVAKAKAIEQRYNDLIELARRIT